MRVPRLGVRTRLLVAIVGAVALALVVAVAAFSLLLGQRVSASATSLARDQAETELSSLVIRNGTLSAPESPNGTTVASQTWVFSGTRLLEAPRAAPEVDQAARLLATGPERSLDIPEQTRLYALPVVRGGYRYGTVVSAVSLGPYEETTRAALIGSLILALLLLGAVTLLSWWMLGRALLPVSRMTEDAASWSEHDLDRRFGRGEPYDELTRLAATLDRLLERIAASLRHEQQFTAELSHELRTPLARAKSHTELALRRERTPPEYRDALEAVDRNIDQMTRTVEILVAAARQEAGLARATSDAWDAVRAAVSNVRETGTPLDLRLSVPAEPARVAVGEELVERMVQPLLDNAVRYGRSAVDVSLACNGAFAIVEVADDGPGVSEDERLRIFEPGTPGEPLREREPGVPAARSPSRPARPAAVSRSGCHSSADRPPAAAAASASPRSSPCGGDDSPQKDKRPRFRRFAGGTGARRRTLGPNRRTEERAPRFARRLTRAKEQRWTISEERSG